MLDVQMAAHAEQLRQLQLDKQAEAARIAADLELHRAELAQAAERQKEKARATQQLMSQQVGWCGMQLVCGVAVATGVLHVALPACPTGTSSQDFRRRPQPLCLSRHLPPILTTHHSAVHGQGCGQGQCGGIRRSCSKGWWLPPRESAAACR